MTVMVINLGEVCSSDDFCTSREDRQLQACSGCPKDRATYTTLKTYCFRDSETVFLEVWGLEFRALGPNLKDPSRPLGDFSL